jgi:hypothetical protein
LTAKRRLVVSILPVVMSSHTHKSLCYLHLFRVMIERKGSWLKQQLCAGKKTPMSGTIPIIAEEMYEPPWATKLFALDSAQTRYER